MGFGIVLLSLLLFFGVVGVWGGFERGRPETRDFANLAAIDMDIDLHMT